MMSDFDRNVASRPYGTISHSEAAVNDAGWRAYMLRVYNYMALGLVITGCAAFGIYMLSVTRRRGERRQGTARAAPKSRRASPAACISHRSATRCS